MKVSVLICTWNRGDLIDDTLRSLIEGSSVKPHEIIVVNGGGEKNCSNTLDFWKSKCSYLFTYEIENITLSHSRNFGLKKLSGEIILMTDDDALVAPDWIKCSLKLHKEYPKAGAIGGPVLDASGDSLLYKVADFSTFPFLKELTQVRSIPGVNSTYKIEALNAVGDYDVNLFRGEDVDFNWRISQLGWQVLYSPELRVYHKHRATWRGLFRQHFMYGRAYVLVRNKWPEMYCAYPRRINTAKNLLKLVYYWIQPFFDAYAKIKNRSSSLNEIFAYPFIVLLQYYWRLGVNKQKRILSQNKL